MKPSVTFKKATVFHFMIMIGIVFWTAILFGLWFWAYSGEHEHFDETVKLKAESMAQHSQTLRRWIGGHGGVYVEVDDQVKPM